MAKIKPLTPNQERFCEEYLKDLNATQAAIRAGYSTKANAAGVEASRLLRNPNVMARCQELMNSRSKKTGITAEVILQELYKLATVDITQAFDDMGKLKPLKELPEDVRKSISSLDVSEIYVGSGDDKLAIGLNNKIRFYDKTKALELLGKHLKLFTDKLEHTGKVETGPQVIVHLPSNGSEADS